MAKQYNIENSHKGEMLEIIIAIKNPDGTVIREPLRQTVTITLGRTASDDAFLSFDDSDHQVAMISEEAGEWYIKLTEAELNGLQEDKSYHYNIWSQMDGEGPRLQAYGRLKRKPAVRAPHLI